MYLSRVLPVLVTIPALGALGALSFPKHGKVIGMFSSLVTLWVSLAALWLFDESYRGFQFVPDGWSLGVDGLSLWLIVLTAVVVPVALLSNWSSISKVSYIVIMLLISALTIGVFMVTDVVLFYVLFESILPPLFVLIGIYGSGDRFRAGFFLFLYTLFGSLFMLLSILVLVFTLGTTSIESMFRLDLSFSTQLYVFLGLFIAFAVKTPTVLLNPWLLRAHVESPLGGSILLAGIVLKLSLYGVLRLILPIVPEGALSVTPAVITLCVITMIYASASALRSVDSKELVAYSSVAHAAIYLLAAFSNSIVGIEGAFILGLAHGFVSSGMFTCVGGVLYDRTSTRSIPFYRGMAMTMPIFSILLFLLCLGNTGVPFTLNFVGEFLSLAGAFERSPTLGILASTSMILSSAFTFYMFNRMILGGSYSSYISASLADVTKRECVLLLSLVIITVTLGVAPSVITQGIQESVSGLLYGC